MFGYVRPARTGLSEQETARYQAVYCGLCRTLAKRYGFVARFTLNYDFTFLALLLTHAEPDGGSCSIRCPAHPFSRRAACPISPGLEAAADESVLLAARKLRDTVRDEGFFRGLGARIAALFLRPAARKAARRRPAFAQRLDACLEELDGLERANSPSLDRVADTFARILQAAAPPSGEEAADRALAELLYHVGRWIYLVDALDDFEDDRANGRYNPIAARFGGEVDREALRTTMAHSRALSLAAFALLPPWENSVIAEHILAHGLPTAETLVLEGKWNETMRHRR